MMRTYAEAGAELSIPASWLEKHKDELPHTEFGPTHIRFSDADMDEIREMHRKRPAAAAAPVEGLPGILLALKPAGARHRAAGAR
ncbi:DNA-binding protein [Streptacidiphilus sp. N1-3]|uniref:DNA-binding protein n=1 Tax=Streptacidiphilus alkalitolerans TaxID=3342712 RepID=A0ABV6X7M0_9ACTN